MRKILIPIAFLALLVGVFLATRREAPEWTSSSPDAIGEFEAALDALNKLYFQEAFDRLERTLEIDPDFALAQMLMLQFADHDDRAEALERIEAFDLDRLTPRERFLIRYQLAEYRGEGEESGRILEEYAARYPDDPYTLFTHAERSWREQDWDDAEHYYRELIEKHPNWVRAQNYLGYIEMTRGNFTAAEDHFRTYLYIAPDQANPYDSLAELLILLGREREAEEALRKAIEIRPDFCASYARLVDLRTLQGSSEDMDWILEATEEHCGGRESFPRMLDCRSDLWAKYDAADFEGAWNRFVTDCGEVRAGDLELLKHRMALLVGETETADRIEAAVGKTIDHDKPAPRGYADFSRAALMHMQGTRLAIEGDFAAAANAFRQSDDYLRYWAAREGTGMFKLYNQLNLVRALAADGQDEEAEAALADIGEVNPTLVARFDEMRAWFGEPDA